MSATSSLFFDPGHRGNFTWRVRACLDNTCIRASEFSEYAFFKIEAKPGPPGLVPCGRKFDYPGTPDWCETEPCQPRHIFILLYIIINFALWKIIPLILVILVVYTGAMFYLAITTENAEVMPKVKALWRTAGIGFGLIFLSWFIVTWILWLFGYQLGLWHIIPI